MSSLFAFWDRDGNQRSPLWDGRSTPATLSIREQRTGSKPYVLKLKYCWLLCLKWVPVKAPFQYFWKVLRRLPYVLQNKRLVLPLFLHFRLLYFACTAIDPCGFSMLVCRCPPMAYAPMLLKCPLHPGPGTLSFLARRPVTSLLWGSHGG